MSDIATDQSTIARATDAPATEAPGDTALSGVASPDNELADDEFAEIAFPEAADSGVPASDAATPGSEASEVAASGVSDAAGGDAAGGDAAGSGGVVVDKAAIDDVEEAMRDVVDPELGINVVDLGLLYGIDVHDDNSVTLDMTLTSAACPLTDVIEDQTRSALSDGPDALVNDVIINWVWMPPWGPDKITDDGREQLRALGFNV